MGQASGGLLAALLEHPRRIASAALGNGSTRMSGETRAASALGEPSQEAALAKYGVAEWCGRTLARRLDPQRAPAQLVEWVAAEVARMPVSFAAAAVRVRSALELTPRLGQLCAPVLPLVGARYAEPLRRHPGEARALPPRA